jgi:hypothetical protein
MANSPDLCERIDRRALLKGAAAFGLAPALEPLATAAAPPPPPGAAAEDRPFIDGYTDQLSYRAGDAIGLHISTSAARFGVEVARIGATRDVVWTQRGLSGVRHRVPDDASTHGCRWPAALALPVPDTWRSGYYQVLLQGEERDGRQPAGETFFVVRSAHPGRGARILLQLTTNTYNAYNNWGGTSLYGGPRGQGSRVAFDRPYAGFAPGDAFTSKYSGWRNWEQPFVAWAEAAGYRLDFAVNSDLEFHPKILEPYRLVLSVGHDEYWSAPMRDHLEAFIAAGGNVAFFSGNAVFWQVRSEDGGRALVSWKQHYTQDPVYQGGDHRLLTGLWSHRLIHRPENQLTGVSFCQGGYHHFFEQFPEGTGAYTIHRPDHWIFAGTGLKRGDSLGAKDRIVGYECDGCQMTWQDGLPFPTHQDGTPESFVILGTAPAGLSAQDNSIGWVSEGLYGDSGRRIAQPGAAVLGCYTRGGTVVTTGCTEWSNGLRGRDPLVELITCNILDRLSKS